MKTKKIKLINHTSLLRRIFELHQERRQSASDVLARTDSEIEAVREQLPVAILAHYETRLRRGRSPVSVVRDGICQSCHLVLPRGSVIDLARSGGGAHVCVHCGSFIYLEEADARPPECRHHTKKGSC